MTGTGLPDSVHTPAYSGMDGLLVSSHDPLCDWVGVGSGGGGGGARRLGHGYPYPLPLAPGTAQ